MPKTKISVIVWNEFQHETPALNPGALPLEIGSATLDQPEHRLSEERLAGCGAPVQL